MNIRVLSVALCGIGLAAMGLRAAAGPPALVAAYVTGVGFTQADLDLLESGSVIAKVVSNDSDAEIMVAGAVKIRASREFVLQYYNQMITYVDGQVTLQYGKFSRPPALADVAALTLDPADIETLKSCKPGDCDLKLGARGIETVRAAIDFRAPDYPAKVNAYVRQTMVDYVSAYLSKGDAALVTYNDRQEQVSLAAQWQGILANSPKLPAHAPALKAYLETFPGGGPLAGGQDTFYWVKENYGKKPTISIVHMVTYKDPQRPEQTIVAQKQIYASHYLEGSLALAVVVEAQAGTGGNGLSYLMYANRSRGDMLKGGFGGLKRTVGKDQAKKAAVSTLETIQGQLERALGLR